MHSPPRRGTHRPGSCNVCGGLHDIAGVEDTYVYLLGLYLGDGHISPFPRGVFRLRITLDTKYPGIVNSAAQAMDTISGRRASITQRCREKCVDVISYWKSWPRLVPQHGPGHKHERTIELTDWQRPLAERHAWQLLRGLIHADGCRFINTGRCG